MQTFRTLLWVVVTAFIVMFVAVNYGEKHDVIIWPLSNDALVFEWPVGVIALMFWLLGVFPTWLYHSGVRWSLKRRIRSLENAARSNALQRRAEPASGDPALSDPDESSEEQPLTPTDNT
jgi:putative membrane protein